MTSLKASTALWCALAGCNLGATDHSLVTVSVSSLQPSDPTDGISIEISAYCGSGKSACLLQAGAIGGRLQRPGDPEPAGSFCQHQFLLEPMPVVVFAPAEKQEVIVQARLLDGSDQALCQGRLLSEAQAVVSARAAGAADAGGADAR